ncbi:MAG: hypothetical protein HKN68_04345 [Saprospiraceae bacterium]|nr:hypothetical protein [Saprospiraceae bacterium]
MKKTYLVLLLILVCCVMNQTLKGQELVKIWEKTFPSLEIEQTANLKRNSSHMDMDGDGGPDLVAFNHNNETVLIRNPSGDSYYPYELINIFLSDYQFAGFYNFFDTSNGLKQMLMVQREDKKIIGILIGVIGDDNINFNNPIPDEINDNESSIININDWNKNNYEEIKVTFQDVTSSNRAITIWEYER